MNLADTICDDYYLCVLSKGDDRKMNLYIPLKKTGDTLEASSNCQMHPDYSRIFLTKIVSRFAPNSELINFDGLRDNLYQLMKA